MSNHLEMVMIQQVLTLHHLGWSNRRIAGELGLHRETVGRHLALAGVTAASPPALGSAVGSDSKPANNPPTGSEVGADSKPANNPPAGSAGSDVESHPAESGVSGAIAVAASAVPVRRAGPASACAAYREQIEAKLAQGLSAQRIYQDLVCEANFPHGYDSVKRFVRQLSGTKTWPFRRMPCAPGHEVQVDFGTGALLDSGTGKRRKSHVFRIVLSYSRKGYSEAVYRQTTEDFLGCLENAFWYFGGVPETIVIDNLKAAVKQPDWYDPELTWRVESFCAHYGTVILPTKPRTPRHKDHAACCTLLVNSDTRRTCGRSSNFWPGLLTGASSATASYRY